MSTLNALETDTSYLGLINILASSTADYSEIIADIEGEQETVPDLIAEDFELQEGSTESIGLPSQWEDAISSVGKGVTDSTHNEYIRLDFYITASVLSTDWDCSLFEAAVRFFISQKLITKREQFFSKKPQENADKLIVAWIMHE
jgi:hypothetical protein